MSKTVISGEHPSKAYRLGQIGTGSHPDPLVLLRTSRTGREDNYSRYFSRKPRGFRISIPS
jgi:hypothetical protein